MPPMIATPVAIPQGKEQGLDQEFELDIRVSSVRGDFNPSSPTKATGGCCYTINTCSCTCTCNTCHIVATHCIHE